MSGYYNPFSPPQGLIPKHQYSEDEIRERLLEPLTIEGNTYPEKFSKPCNSIEVECSDTPINPFTGEPIKVIKMRDDAFEVLGEGFNIRIAERDKAANRLKNKLKTKDNEFVIYKETFWPKHCKPTEVVRGIKSGDRVVIFGVKGGGSRNISKLLKALALEKGHKFINLPPVPKEIFAGLGRTNSGYKVVSTRGPQKFEVGDQAFVSYGTNFWEGQVVEIVEGPKWVKSGFGSYRVRSRKDPTREVWMKSGDLKPLDSDIYEIEEVQL